MTKVSDLIATKREDFITLISIATALFSEKFYAGKTQDWGNVTSDAAKNAEAQFNDPTSGVYGSSQFAATIKALTGEDIKLRNPQTVSYVVGVAVVPVEPAYGKRTNDGYTIGQPYLCTNESSTGKFRGVDNLGDKGVRTTKAGERTGDSTRNEWQLMSKFSDEVRPATEDEIATLVDGLLAVKGLSLLQDISPELTERYAHFIK